MHPISLRGNRIDPHPVVLCVHEHLLSAHDGVITAQQARDCGLGEKWIRRRVAEGLWQRRFSGVYFVADRPFTTAARIRCAVWGAGDNAVASGLAAAFWHKLTDEAPAQIDVTVPRSGRSRASGCRLRRRDLSDKDVVERRGLRVTSLDLTVLEAGIDNSALVDRALQRFTSTENLRRAHTRNAGRTGARKAARLIRAAESGARSEAERLFIALLRAAAITGWFVNFRYGGYEIDVAFPDERLAIEIDGWAYHSDANAFQNDRTRQNALTKDWRVLRYTWADLTERPQQVLAQIQGALNEIRC